MHFFIGVSLLVAFGSMGNFLGLFYFRNRGTMGNTLLAIGLVSLGVLAPFRSETATGFQMN